MELASEIALGKFINPAAVQWRWAVSVEQARRLFEKHAPRFDKARMLPV
jgi:hypothetical protein